MIAIPSRKQNIIQAPHVVILGAGASLAAFPNGDKNDRKLPLMKSLADALELSKIIPPKYAALFNNFEKLYSTIHGDNKETKLKLKIDDMVYQYFYEMEIPETPTLYDYLVLSLREKDIIATFNWDPLLLQCMRRHAKIGHLPKVHFLHGNVAVGFCKNCNLSCYSYNLVCHRCYNSFIPMKLLYPIEKKDYSADITIREEWNSLEYYLQHALYVTIFGYSAPDSDIDAKNLMLDSFVKNKSRQLGQLEFIDIKEEDEVKENWYDFLYKNHYSIVDKLERSYLWNHPRRSCDAFYSAYLMNSPWENNSFPKFKTIKQMHNWIKPLVEDEEGVIHGQKGFRYKAK